MIFERERAKEKTKSIWNWRHFCGQLSWHHTSMFYSGSLTPYKDKRSKKSRRWTCHSFQCHSSQPEVVKANICWGLELEFYVLQAYIPVVLVSFKTLWGPDKRTKVKKVHRRLVSQTPVSQPRSKLYFCEKLTTSSKLISLTCHLSQTYSKLFAEKSIHVLLHNKILGNRIGIILGKCNISLWFVWS